MSDIQTPATEIEIAEAVSMSDGVTAATIRKLAFERDALKRSRSEQEQAVYSAASSIVDAWDDWDGEAQQAAQQDQDSRSYRFVMMTNIVSCIWRNMGWCKS